MNCVINSLKNNYSPQSRKERRENFSLCALCAFAAKYISEYER